MSTTTKQLSISPFISYSSLPGCSALAKRIQKHGVTIFGAGLLGRHIVQKLLKLGIKVNFFLDETPSKSGETLNGIKVKHPSEYYRNTEVPVITAVMSGKNLCKNITNRLIKQYNLDAYSYLELEKTIPGSVLPFLYLENAGNCYQKSFKYFNLVKKLLDNQSQAELERNFQIRLNYNLNSSIEPEKQFFSCLRSFPKIKSGELCFVDVGAYDGDTINDFLGVFSNQYQRIIAFEPDSANFDKLKNYAQKNLAKNSFELHQKASWHQECELSFQADANMGSFMSSTGNTKVKTITLDSILAKSDFKDIFIKLDVEGAEPETIKGMSQTIKAHEPILAISVYHHPDHLWQCFEMIEQLSQNYSYLLRSYGGDGLDLLLYAIPDRFL